MAVPPPPVVIVIVETLAPEASRKCPPLLFTGIISVTVSFTPALVPPVTVAVMLVVCPPLTAAGVALRVRAAPASSATPSLFDGQWSGSVCCSTPALCRMLRKHHPLYLNTHFNHPWEITPESAAACAMLADAGIPLGNQTVLLRGVNDEPQVMKGLMQRLLVIRVRPYYIHQMDLVRGTSHFRTKVQRGIEVMEGLRGHTSGLATPYYVIDLPGGKGKVPILQDYVRREEGRLFVRNYLGEEVEYPDI